MPSMVFCQMSRPLLSQLLPRHPRLHLHLLKPLRQPPSRSSAHLADVDRYRLFLPPRRHYRCRLPRLPRPLDPRRPADLQHRSGLFPHTTSWPTSSFRQHAHICSSGSITPRIPSPKRQLKRRGTLSRGAMQLVHLQQTRAILHSQTPSLAPREGRRRPRFASRSRT